MHSISVVSVLSWSLTCWAAQKGITSAEHRWLWPSKQFLPDVMNACGQWCFSNFLYTHIYPGMLHTSRAADVRDLWRYWQARFLRAHSIKVALLWDLRSDQMWKGHQSNVKGLHAYMQRYLWQHRVWKICSDNSRLHRSRITSCADPQHDATNVLQNCIYYYCFTKMELLTRIKQLQVPIQAFINLTSRTSDYRAVQTCHMASLYLLAELWRSNGHDGSAC